MEPGAENVYLKQQGTGAATVLGGSSFDPVKFAQYAGALKQGQKAAADKAKKDNLDKAFNALKLDGADVLDKDQEGINNYRNAFINYTVGKIASGEELSGNNLLEGTKYQTQFNEMGASLGNHKKMVGEYLTLSKAKDMNTDAMINQSNKYINPQDYVDTDPKIAETFMPIYEQMKNDPVYKTDPLTAAKNKWRNNEGRDYISKPIYKDIDLLEHWGKQGVPLISKNSKYIGKRLADGTTITEENIYKLPFDTEVELEGGEKITLPGSRSVAASFYQSDPMVKQSADNLFKNAGEGMQKQYIDQYGEDAASENYYIDFVSPFGTEASTKNIAQAPLPGGNTYRHGTKTYPFEVSFDEGGRNYNRAGQFGERGKEEITFDWATVPVRGVSFGADKKKYPIVTVNPQRIFNQNSLSWVKDRSQFGQNLDFTVSGVYQMPSLKEQIDLSTPEYAPFTKWAARKYGNKKGGVKHTALQDIIFNEKGELRRNIIVDADTPLSKLEARQLKKIRKTLVGTGTFATGEINGMNETTGQKLYIQGATIPYADVKTQVEGATNGTEWEVDINNKYGADDNWYDAGYTEPADPIDANGDGVPDKDQTINLD